MRYQTATWQDAVGDVTPAQLLAALRERVAKSTVLPSLEKGAYIGKEFPQMAADTIRMADEALQGMLVLPGTGKKLHFVGNPPLWTDNPPQDNEYTFHLNRMHHWKTMSEAYSLTGDLRYAQKVVQELEDWIDQSPCPALYDEQGRPNTEPFKGLEVWRALEVGIRGYRTWPMLVELLIDSGCITEKLLEKLLPCVHLHCRLLYEISPVLWPKADHNHYLMENLGLLSFACMFPELKHSAEYREHAQHQLDRCIEAQCTPDGGQIEGCPSYHNGCVFWFALRLVLANKYELTVPQAYSDKVRLMFRHSVHATRSSGGNFPINDSHGIMVETMSLAAVSCYMAFGEKEYLAVARHFFTMEDILRDLRDNLWRLRNLLPLGSDLAFANSNPQAPTFTTLNWQRQLDQVCMRSGWDSDAVSVMTGCHTPVQNLHAHMDPGGFDLAAFGDTLVTDPGIYTYKHGEDRHYFKSTLSHNCLTIDRKDAWEFLESWKYGPQREGHMVFAEALLRVQYALSRHHNYHPVTADRLLALLDGRWLLVVDMVTGLQPENLVGIGFNLNSDQVDLFPDGTAVTTRPGKPNVKLVPSGSHKEALLEEARISPINDIADPSRIVRYQAVAGRDDSYRQATLILPFAKDAAVPQADAPVLIEDEKGLSILLNVEGVQTKLLLHDQRLTVL